ncbi:MAG: TusE/DsrC/DsvC family sulfur relay protein [gamma proteobacterium endosymbiont of Lamellibrachia anaximandri]|nr:TusE/DsrC/DsvC family sulfur relay protein [gamma proteobacterium endosymbiont of Lamellibrachia anaximandri]
MVMTAQHSQAPGSNNLQMDFDDDGFLIDPYQWNRKMAQTIAETDGIGNLGHDHWAVIHYMRECHLNSGGLPVMSHICRKMHLDKHGVEKLFGGCREAWRIAGLPNPGEEAKTYM